ncbi:hypothetical protein F5Y18DRAFT_1749 [Xylariaceae sp. FL1019]|nr:hypothetical protein F5Y18DRAFT_1749 [Xylariaceae sp. FL1019]
MPAESLFDFDELLNLEEQYYNEGYSAGLADGAEAGRIEGYSLGLTQGFEKFVEAGRLRSKATIWANRVLNLRQRSLQNHAVKENREKQGTVESDSGQETETRVEGEDAESDETEQPKEANRTLPPIQSNARLEKNITTLYGLVEPGTLSTKNDDEAVNDFDSRLKGAQGKVRIIERAIGEGGHGKGPGVETGAGGGTGSVVGKNEI